MRRYAWLGISLVLLGLWAWLQSPDLAPQAGHDGSHTQQPASTASTSPVLADIEGDARWPAFLPAQAIDTLRRIEHDGPFDHRQDGGTFQNRERLLPIQHRGYYREYTVPTPGSRDRGARRIVSGGGTPGQRPPVEYFYTDDHYRSFRRFVPATVVPDR